MDNRKNTYLFYKPTEDLEAKVQKIRELGRKYDFQLVDDPKDASIIVSFGGDGSFLQAVRKTGFRDDCLYIGVNDGQLGFYTDFSTDNLEKIEAGLKSENIEVLKYPTLEVTVDGVHTFYCLNELSIRSRIIKTFALDVYIDGIFLETFRGDGLVVSTPTGSTAYNKSLNGAVVDPKLKGMQLTEVASLNNNQYRTLGSPLLLNNDRELVLKVVQDGNVHPIMGADNEALSVKQCHQVNIKVSEREIKTLRMKDNLFIHKVRRSFL